MSSILLAVYGTLRKGCRNGHLLEEETYLGTERLDGFVMYISPDYRCPYLIEGDGAVTFEVYEISEAAFARTDELEDYPDHYLRKQFETEHGLAWIYLVNPEDEVYPELMASEPLASGDWLDQ